ncbi:MAG TPA: thioredoxin domain-containing protein [Anaerolineae bacterium]|nr:thioredoxin domain-containing protein [Anaerolineae bacterium]
MSNRLANETSPYLLQHAENPVDWYPWGEEALGKAREEEKPIFLSIGYSACHWCHVMEHESFEDEQVARILNQNFVSIKVDREERPDLDQIYMNAVQAMTGSGGWPMSVFLTPAGAPFYGGTYFPPQPRYGMPSFTQVLAAIADAWQNRRQELVQGGRRLAAALEEQMTAASASAQVAVEPETLHSAFRALAQQFDDEHGGWGGAPKFPQPMAIEFLLRYHVVTASEPALQMATFTLDKMARGGMYDQLGGGFHRYSVDDHWLVPHFEKMLYDNSQLARVYLHAWQLTGDEFYRTIAEETLDYVAREMTSPEGGFYSTQDADSEGEEGKFFVWTVDEIRATLGNEADEFIEAYGVKRGGNWEGKNILELKGTLEQREKLAGARAKLFDVREARVHPGRDEKVITAWNGLMLAAFAEAAAAFGLGDDPSRAPSARADRYRQIAEANADFLLHHLQTDAGRLFRTWKAAGDNGNRGSEGTAKIDGFLEDYAHLVEGLLALYQATFDPRWYQAAHALVDSAVARFWVTGEGFYDTAEDTERLITRPRDLQDNATPSGNAMMATVLLKLSDLAMEHRYADLARENLGAVQDFLARAPLGFGQWLVALDYALSRPFEIAIVGSPGDEATRRLLGAAMAGFRPHQVVAYGPAGTTAPAVPLLEDRGLVDGKPAAYVCRDSICQAPVTAVEELQAQLDSLR